MKGMSVQQWCTEVVLTGDIVQDGDESIPQEQAEERFNRYVQLIDMVTGRESRQVFQALVDSIRASEDYGAYEGTHNALWKFPPDKFAEYLVPALPRLIERMARHDQVGRFLCPLFGWAKDEYLPAFNQALGRAPTKTQEAIVAFVREDEDGWFEDNADLIRAESV